MDRYSRQTIMPEIGRKGQEKLKDATVAIVGMGALGTVEAELLVRAGVGTLILIDADVVELDNLQRQSLYIESDVARLKVEAAKERLAAINSDVTVRAFAEHLTPRSMRLLEPAGLVLDGTDNMESRFSINTYCLAHRIPAIFVSAVRDRGSVLVVDKELDPDGPCYDCLFAGRRAEDDCCSAGVLNGATHLAATVAATEALKVLLGLPTMKGFFSFSLIDGRFDMFGTKRRSDCSVCKR